jgi:hypothetical protein
MILGSNFNLRHPSDAMFQMIIAGIRETPSPDAVRCLTLVVAALLAAGCNRTDADRCSVSGSVTMAGQPVDGGNIQFAPLAANQPTASGAVILVGRYTVPKTSGLVPGKYRVRIYWPEKAGLEQNPKVPIPKERIPAQFNVHSELAIKVERGAPNSFDFSVP